MIVMKHDDDICNNNHGGNAQSVKAHTRVRPHKASMRERIYHVAVQKGRQGAIAEDLYRPLGIGDNTGTARCSELKRDGKLVISGRLGTTLSGSDADLLIADIYAV